MKDNIYTLLNDMDIRVESYETSEVSPEEIKRWKTEFRKRNGKVKKKRHVGRYIAAAVVVLVLGLAMGPFQRETYAQMKVVTSSVQEWLGIKSDLSSYETLVGQTIAKDGVTITVNDVVMDGETMLVSYTLTAAEAIDTVEEMEYLCFVDVQVNGSEVYGGGTGETEKVDDHNMISVDSIVLEDVDVTKENYYKLIFSIEYYGEDEVVIPKKIGAVEFAASGEKLQAETITIPLDVAYEFPNGEKINLTKYTYNAVGPKIYCDSETGGFDYNVWLRGEDNLGNEIALYLTHYGGDGGWFVMDSDMYVVHEEATSLTLSLYALELSDESGDMGNDYQVIGEPFTIELK